MNVLVCSIDNELTVEATAQLQEVWTAPNTNVAPSSSPSPNERRSLTPFAVSVFGYRGQQWFCQGP